MPENPPEHSPDAPADLPPAYFLSLTLENVRCFGPEQTLDLSDDGLRPAQWTVLLGDNGVGKTTILQALAGLNTVDSVQFDDDLPYVEPLLTSNYSLYSKWRGSARRKNELLGLECKIGFADDLLENVQKQSQIELGTGYAMILPTAAKIQCIGYGVSRKMEKSGFEEADTFGVMGLFDDEFLLPNAHDWLRQTDYAAKSGKDMAARRLSQILEVLAVILPDVEEVQIKDQEGDLAHPKAEFYTPYGWVRMDQLSLGYRTMIAWIVDLARRLFERYPDMENPLEGPAVCLVDEIDLHLHPKWQRKIIGFLSERFPNTQFIVTAHSPLIVQAAQDANIAVLKRSDEPDETGAHYVEIHNDLEPLRNLRVDQILTSDLYGLDSARPPQIEHLVEEKIQLMSKSTLTAEDETRLEELNDEIGFMPAGETPEEREALKILNDISSRIESSSD